MSLDLVRLIRQFVIFTMYRSFLGYLDDCKSHTIPLCLNIQIILHISNMNKFHFLLDNPFIA